MHQFRSGAHGHRAASQQLAVQLDPAALAIPERHGPSAAGSQDRQEGRDSSTARSRSRQSFQGCGCLCKIARRNYRSGVGRARSQHEKTQRITTLSRFLLEIRLFRVFCRLSWRSGRFLVFSWAHRGPYSLFLRKDLIALGWDDAVDLSRLRALEPFKVSVAKSCPSGRSTCRRRSSTRNSGSIRVTG